MTVYGELFFIGRYPLYISIYVRTIRYWTKVIQTENIIIKSLYDTMIQQRKKVKLIEQKRLNTNIWFLCIEYTKQRKS